MEQDKATPNPTYNFPGCGSLLAVLFIVALLAAVAIAGTGTDTVQNMAHPAQAVEIRP